MQHINRLDTRMQFRLSTFVVWEVLAHIRSAVTINLRSSSTIVCLGHAGGAQSEREYTRGASQWHASRENIPRVRANRTRRERIYQITGEWCGGVGELLAVGRFS
eukprot:628146-Prorocentrum_minimum.AAC.1